MEPGTRVEAPGGVPLRGDAEAAPCGASPQYFSDRCELQHLGGGQGRGFVATSDIPQGETVLRDKAFVSILDGTWSSLLKLLLRAVGEGGDRERWLPRVLALYPSPEEVAERQLPRLCHRFEADVTPGTLADRLGYILAYNVYEIYPDKAADEDDDTDGAGLFLTGSLVNHSCEPNCVYVFEDEDVMVVRTTRPVTAGEELCMPYLPNLYLPTAERRRRLERDLGFACLCGRCRDPAADGPLGGAALDTADAVIELNCGDPAKAARGFAEAIRGRLAAGGGAAEWAVVEAAGHCADAIRRSSGGDAAQTAYLRLHCLETMTSLLPCAAWARFEHAVAAAAALARCGGRQPRPPDVLRGVLPAREGPRCPCAAAAQAAHLWATLYGRQPAEFQQRWWAAQSTLPALPACCPAPG